MGNIILNEAKVVWECDFCGLIASVLGGIMIRGCKSCSNKKYIQDPSTTICVTCRYMNGDEFPDNWEPIGKIRIEKEIIEEMIEYIESNEVEIDTIGGKVRMLDQIIKDGDMPEVYNTLIKIIGE